MIYHVPRAIINQCSTSLFNTSEELYQMYYRAELERRNQLLQQKNDPDRGYDGPSF